MEEELNLNRLFGTLWRGKLWIVLSGFLFLVAGTWYAYGVAVPIYTATSTIALDTREQNVVDIQNVVTGLSGDQSTINTEMEVIRSRKLVEKLVRNLRLYENPEFNRRLREIPMVSVGVIKAYITELLFGVQPPEAEPSERELIDSVINVTLSKLKIINPRSSFVFHISAQTTSPELSTQISNGLAQLYIDDQIQVKFEKTEQATRWLSQRVADLQITLQQTETELKVFGSTAELISPESLLALNRQFKEFKERRDSLKVSLDDETERVGKLEQALTEADFMAFEEIAKNRSFSLAMQNKDRISIDVLGTQAQRVLTEANGSIARMQKQLAAVKVSIADVSKKIDRQSDELVELQQLQREVEANRLIYEAFLGRLKETSIQQGIQQADSRLLSNAVVPTRPTAPRKSMIMAFSLMLGTICGSIALLARETSQKTFRSAEDLERVTGQSVLGQIPSISARRRVNVIKYLVEKPNSGAAEAIRNLRTSLLLANVDKVPQLIMSTSSIPGEGKTTQSIALAQNFAGLGEKVLLVEGDVRRRVLNEYFNIGSKKGFLSVLSGDASLDDVIQSNDLLNADILIGETSPVNAADLFSSEKFQKLLTTLRGKYDRVIIDTPPVLAVPDARVIGQKVDAIVYTVKWDSTSHRQVLDGLKSLEFVNLSVSGLVLGQINKRGMQRYGYGDSYGSYQGYYDN